MSDDLEKVESALEGDTGEIDWWNTARDIRSSAETRVREATRKGGIKLAYPILGACNTDFQESLEEKEPAYNAEMATLMSAMGELYIGGVAAGTGVPLLVTGDATGPALVTLGGGLIYDAVKRTHSVSDNNQPVGIRQNVEGAYNLLQSGLSEAYHKGADRLDAAFQRFDDKYLVRK